MDLGGQTIVKIELHYYFPESNYTVFDILHFNLSIMSQTISKF